MHAAPLVFYRGPHAAAPLVDGAHAGFDVRVGVLLRAGARSGASGTVSVRGAWGEPAPAAAQADVTLAAGEERMVVLNLTAEARDVRLWWPVGLAGERMLYNVTASFAPSRAAAAAAAAAAAGTTAAQAPAAAVVVSTTRAIGFRVVALVTGNDTDPA